MTNLNYDLREYILRHHSGKANAIKRSELLRIVEGWGYLIGDRDLREAYVEIGACAGSDGIFWPMTWAEVIDCADYLDDKAIGHFERAKHLREIHTELRQVRQLELFG